MAGYPPYLTRLSNFRQSENAGQPIDTAALDSDFNQLVEDVNQLNLWVRNITTASNTLKNLSAATAQALAGSQSFTATASQTVFVTTIVYDVTMNNTNVQVFSNGVLIKPALVTVGSTGNFLSVTIPAQPVNAVVVVNAYTSGAGIATMLASTATGAGASLVAIEDASVLYAASTVESALAEVMLKLNQLIGNLGVTANLIRSTGALPFAADQSMGMHKLTNVAPGVAGTDVANINQLTTVLQGFKDSLNQFLRLDGASKMLGDLDMNGNKILGLPAASAAFVSPVEHVGSIKIWGGLAPPAPREVSPGVNDEWALCNGGALSRTTYAALFAIIGTFYGTGDGVTTFNLPNLSGRVPCGVGQANVGETTRTLGAAFGTETHTLTEAQMPTHTHRFQIGNFTATEAPHIITASDIHVSSAPTRDIETFDKGGGQAHPNCQPTVTMNFIIRVR
jgi:microcystin-dependent protein